MHFPTIDNLEPVWVLEVILPEWGNEIQDECKSRVHTMSLAYVYMRESRKKWMLTYNHIGSVEWTADDGSILLAHVIYKVN